MPSYRLIWQNFPDESIIATFGKKSEPVVIERYGRVISPNTIYHYEQGSMSLGWQMGNLYLQRKDRGIWGYCYK